MIASDTELQTVKRQLEEFQLRLQMLFNRKDLSHFEVHLTASGYDKMISRLERELDEYKSMRDSQLASDDTARA